jgi:hypothetical protein
MGREKNAISAIGRGNSATFIPPANDRFPSLAKML